MYVSWQLARYLGGYCLGWVLSTLGGLAVVIFTFDLVELLRRAAGKDQAGMGLVLQMAFYKLPHMIMLILPFGVLFGCMIAFWKLTKSHELVVTRAAGVSAWSFLLPIILLVFLLGFFATTVFNPLSATLLNQYETMENKYLKGQTRQLAVSSEGIWLRQSDVEGMSILHARTVSQQGTHLTQVSIFQFDETNEFNQRLEAEKAVLEPGHWILQDVVINTPGKALRKKDTFSMPTRLTPAEIQDSFASPETLSFWSLPGFIHVLEQAGFSATQHRLYWHSLVAKPVLLCSMVLIAAAFALRQHRSGKIALMISAGIFAGFLLYFLSDLISAMGLSGRLPVVVAAWTVPVVSLLGSVSALLHLEDG